MWYALAFLLVVHGLIHVMGFAKAFGARSLPFATHIGKPLGIAWLVAALLMVTGAGLLLANSRSWWLPVVPGLLLSQALILSAFVDAKFGTLPNIIIAIAVVVSIVRGGPAPPRSTSPGERASSSESPERRPECRRGFASQPQANS